MLINILSNGLSLRISSIILSSMRYAGMFSLLPIATRVLTSVTSKLSLEHDTKYY